MKIALIAHEGKKAAMLDWATCNRDFLSKHSLVATGTTGSLLESEVGLRVQKMLSGPLGSDLHLAR